MKGTEAIQPNDGRFTILRDQSEWMSRHAHEVEKFCMFFHSVKEAQRYLPRFTAIEGVEVVQGSPDNIEVTAAGVNKGESLLALADHLGIPARPHWLWATARMTAPCWKRQASPP